MTDETLFAVALEQRTSQERAQYLAESCRDPEQRARLEGLLAAHDRAGRFLDRPPLVADSVTRSFTPDSDTRPADPPADEAADDLSFLAPPARPDSLGHIGQYDVLEVLGRGGFGIVFRAFDDKLQRVVAVKVLAPQMAATSPARKRFLREARSAAAVRHENVVQVYAVEEQPLPHLAMEYLPGETLQQRLDRTGPLDVPEVLRTGRQIAAGLAAAHEKGLIHRDIKPSNILLDAGPHPAVKITDFGLARAADDASLTRSGVVAGTPMYMAPEQARGEALDHRADLFSLGSVLYALLTGRPPFRAGNTPAVLKRVADDTPRPIREVIPEVPEWLCRIVEKLHAKDPAGRFQNAKELTDVLADCEKQLAERKELTDLSRIPAGQPTARKPRRWRWAALAAAATVLAVLTIAALFWRPISLFATDSGELVLDDADPTFQVTVRQGGRVVRDGSTQREFVLPADDATELQFRSVTGTDVFRKDVAIPRGGRVRVNVAEELAAVEQRNRDAVSNKLKELGEAANRYGDGFTPLFDGKTLNGWKTITDQDGDWKVQDGKLVGSGRTTSFLFSERGDFENFHIRFEAKLSANGNSGVFVRAPFGLPITQTMWGSIPGGLHAQFDANESTVTAGRLWYMRLRPFLNLQEIPIDTWFTEEVIAQGDWIVVKVNGITTTDIRNPQLRLHKGHVVLQTLMGTGAVEFRKIEIKELPVNSREVPKRAADIIPFVVGTWNRETSTGEPKLPPGESRPAGRVTFDWVAGGTVARGRSVDEKGVSTSLILHSYDKGADRLNSWCFLAEGDATYSEASEFDPADRTFKWWENNPDGTRTTHDMTFVDGNTVTARIYDQDASNKIVFKARTTFTRTDQPAVAPRHATDPKRPPEMKVFDRLVGEWRTQVTIKPPGKSPAEAWRTSGRATLGGRFVEVFSAGGSGIASEYAVLWYDPAAKCYRQWYFNGEGHAFPMTGTWDAATGTLSWETADKSMTARWTFTGDDRWEFRHTVNGKDGKPALEMSGVSSRHPDPPKAEAGERAKQVAALEKARDEAKLRFDAGKENKLYLLAAEVALTEARVKLAEAEGNPKEVVAQLEALVAHRQEERDLIEGRVEAESVPPAALEAANARLADAKARLAKVRPPKQGPKPP